MKNRLFLFGIMLIYIIEISMLIVFAFQTPNFSQDAVLVNEIVQTITNDFNSIEKHKNLTSLDYVVIDYEGHVLYKTKSDLSENINTAIINRDTILDITIDDIVVGKVIIYNNSALTLQSQQQISIIIVSTAIAIQTLLCIGFIAYNQIGIVRPFQKLKKFAERVAGGNLDIPLEMDRHNLFGAFTESFDIMRSELKKARLAEAQAQQSKKELVAKLSHDIKTPIASIKAVSEMGFAVTENHKDKLNYTRIIGKTDQLNTLVSNLFTATLEELQQLTVTPTDLESKYVKALLENADYLNRATIPYISDCLIYADALRLQQVFDNVFANAYKYANTEIMVSVQKTSKHLVITVEDFGGGVEREELPILKEKFKRGKNAKSMEGAGLGLYISDYFMKNMSGELNIENGTNGLKVSIILRLSGRD